MNSSASFSFSPGSWLITNGDSSPSSSRIRADRQHTNGEWGDMSECSAKGSPQSGAMWPRGVHPERVAKRSKEKATKQYFERTICGMLTNSTYYHALMGRSLTITVTLVGAILGFGCNTPRVASVGSVEPEANQSFPTNATDPLSARAPSITEDSGFPSEPVSSAGGQGRRD